MKVLVSYACELQDIPEKVAELLGNLEENDLHFVTAELSDARSNSYEKNIGEALEAIDRARIQLAKIDNNLIDYSSILAGYSKTHADLHLGIDPSAGTGNTQEVSANDVLEVKENDVNIEAEKTND
jgi:hypothetical protein